VSLPTCCRSTISQGDLPLDMYAAYVPERRTEYSQVTGYVVVTCNAIADTASARLVVSSLARSSGCFWCLCEARLAVRLSVAHTCWHTSCMSIKGIRYAQCAISDAADGHPTVSRRVCHDTDTGTGHEYWRERTCIRLFTLSANSQTELCRVFGPRACLLG